MATKKPLYKRPWLWVVACAVLAGGGTGATLYFVHAAHFKSTDDAFIDAHVTRVAPQVAGRVESVLVADNQLVTKGDVLLKIDPASFEIALQRAKASRAAARAAVTAAEAMLPAASAKVAEVRANVRAARARAALARTDLERTRGLTNEDVVPQQNLDSAEAQATASSESLAAARKALAGTQAAPKQARSALDAARAKVAEAEVAIDAANLALDRTTIRAPVDGRVTNKAVERGDYVQVGQQLLALVEPHVWVTANFKETELARIRPGQPVSIAIDAYPGTSWKGHVDSLQQGTGSRFSLLPPENATGNYVKVVQRVPVKIVFDEPPDPGRFLLAPGMSVEPEVDVTVDSHLEVAKRAPP